MAAKYKGRKSIQNWSNKTPLAREHGTSNETKTNSLDLVTNTTTSAAIMPPSFHDQLNADNDKLLTKIYNAGRQSLLMAQIVNEALVECKNKICTNVTSEVETLQSVDL
jgi:hypothetical protein